MIAQNASRDRLETALAAIRRGIETIEANPLAAALIGGPALEELREAKGSLQTALE